MTNDKITPDIKLIQQRITRVAISGSTLRGQGTGVTRTSQKFLIGCDINELKKIQNEVEFQVWLDKKTEYLMKQFSEVVQFYKNHPEDSRKNWGGARKALNVFLEEVLYNKYICREYNLDKIEFFLEVPLDSFVINGLRKNCIGVKLPEWNGIKHLKPNISKIFQEYAKDLAELNRIARIHLDLYFWQNNQNLPNQVVKK